MVEGIYDNIPEEEYHALPYLGSTFVKAFSQNPLKAKTQPFKGSPAAELGSAIHKYSLEGKAAFDKDYFVMQEIACPAGQNPKGWKSTNAYKDQVALAGLEADGRIILASDQWDIIQGADKSLRSHDLSKIMLNRGVNEISIIWKDEASQLMCKARLDDYFDGIPADLKTSNDISWFHRDIYNRGYHLQAAHYVNGCIARNLPVRYFCFTAVQTTETYPVRVGYIQPDKLEAAKTEVSRLLGLIKESQERDYWPNFAAPPQIHSWDQLTPADLLEEF